MAKVLTSRVITEEISLELPVKRFSALSHADNIAYCIAQIREHSIGVTNLVVGYILQRALGVREVNHKLLSRWKAEENKIRNPQSSYYTLEDFIKRESEIEAKRYKLYKGLVVGFNPTVINSQNTTYFS